MSECGLNHAEWAAPDRQFFLTIEPQGILGVYQILYGAAGMQTATTEPPTLVCQFARLLVQTGMIVPWERKLLRSASSTRHVRRSLIP
jgi:hypothetical protein